jgi:betaine-aldehyde dehydrogenase
MAGIVNKKADKPTLFIDGEWRHSSSGKSRPTINPFDASVITHVDEASADDAHAAIRSARHFQDTSSWATETFESRSSILSEIARLLQKHKEELSKVEVEDTGKTLAEAQVDVDDVTAVFEFYAQEGKKYDKPKVITGKSVPQSVRSNIVKEAVGVCVLIAPWNCECYRCCEPPSVAVIDARAYLMQIPSFKSAGNLLLRL